MQVGEQGNAELVTEDLEQSINTRQKRSLYS